MYPIIDTHTHLYYKDESERLDFSRDIDKVIERSKAAGVAMALLPNIDADSYPEMTALVERYPGFCCPMIGLHPTEVGADWEEQLSTIEGHFRHQPQRFVAIGEIGLDYHWDLTYKEPMIAAFRQQLEWAVEFGLPVSIHSRDAENEVIELLTRYDANRLRGVVHSFGGNEEQLQAVVRQLPGFMVGINGTITFKNNEMSRFLPHVLPIDRMVVETDAPFLAPVPFRGKRNEPAYLKYVIEKLSQLYGVAVDVMQEVLFVNSQKMFNLPPLSDSL
ncbi:MAG: TatD family hydrolase [Porphyromonas sp.]|nr:TatD family hydrolase [Porphyromonas sp.]